METYLYPIGIEIVNIPIDGETATLRVGEVEKLIDDETAALYLENPSFLGSIEEKVEEIGRIVHGAGALYIVGVDPLSLGILKPPGDYGADIVVGEGQPLGCPPYYGGPLLGIFAVKGDMSLVRQMPGRIIGSTRELYGDREAYTMILQAREQHIRREKATSNICTNQALLAVAAAIYLSLLGEEGFKRLSEATAQRAIYTARKLSSIEGVEAPPYKASFFRDFLVKLPRGVSVKRVLKEALEKGMILGADVGGYFPLYEGSYLTSVSEIHSKKDIDAMVEVLEELVSGRYDG